ncbi:MAG: corrinoid protein [Deltaproteobacteria bacterium]|jgi:5-methyltetrahydrofolate--homocysteine methyltransferase|nr:corrinoid protein [Deltaproteobacteria bacterium]
MEELITEIKDIVVAGKHEEVEALVEKAIADGADLGELINNALIAAMDIVGQRFASSEIFVPEMLVSAMTMKKGLEIIKPLLKEAESQSKGKVVLCTVKGDLHDIGKNLVGMMLEGAGLEVIDLGVDATVDMVIARVKEMQPDVLGLSALLTTTMPEMEQVIETLKTEGIRDKVKVVIGGAPVGADFAAKIGADAYGEDAAEAVTIVRDLINQG